MAAMCSLVVSGIDEQMVVILLGDRLRSFLLTTPNNLLELAIINLSALVRRFLSGNVEKET